MDLVHGEGVLQEQHALGRVHGILAVGKTPGICPAVPTKLATFKAVPTIGVNAPSGPAFVEAL